MVAATFTADPCLKTMSAGFEPHVFHSKAKHLMTGDFISAALSEPICRYYGAASRNVLRYVSRFASLFYFVFIKLVYFPLTGCEQRLFFTVFSLRRFPISSGPVFALLGSKSAWIHWLFEGAVFVSVIIDLVDLDHIRRRTKMRVIATRQTRNRMVTMEIEME